VLHCVWSRYMVILSTTARDAGAVCCSVLQRFAANYHGTVAARRARSTSPPMKNNIAHTCHSYMYSCLVLANGCAGRSLCCWLASDVSDVCANMDLLN